MYMIPHMSSSQDNMNQYVTKRRERGKGGRGRTSCRKPKGTLREPTQQYRPTQNTADFNQLLMSAHVLNSTIELHLAYETKPFLSKARLYHIDHEQGTATSFSEICY
jgi:hypothetical protein